MNEYSRMRYSVRKEIKDSKELGVQISGVRFSTDVTIRTLNEIKKLFQFDVKHNVLNAEEAKVMNASLEMLEEQIRMLNEIRNTI